MAQDPRALLQKVSWRETPRRDASSCHTIEAQAQARGFYLYTYDSWVGRQGSPGCRWRVQSIWRTNRKIRECRGPLHTNCECISNAEARYVEKGEIYSVVGR